MTDPVLSEARLREAAAVVPSPLQLEWQRTEFYGFIHFGMNTMTDVEWGVGHEDPALFDPEAVDTDQWVAVLADAGMRGVILTCKHHDGFALWPSAHSTHTVASSPWRGGRGDLVAELARSCERAGLKFGVYLSPWDRTEASYGTGTPYDDFFVAQLEELLTGYGPLFSVWFDGANGEGADGRRQLYDWDRYYALVRRLQPDAAISVCGPDVRWCGNEAGSTREDEWSVVPASLRDAERTADRSQKADDGRFSRAVRSDEDDLGSREALSATDQPFVWYPAEVNTSTRPGWFHHSNEDSEVRSPAELFEIYRRSVGGNATFLLNVPPTRAGVVSASDVRALSALGGLVRGLSENVVADAAYDFSSRQPDARGLAAFAGGTATWSPDEQDARPTVEVGWTGRRVLDHVILAEDISRGQLVESFEVQVPVDGDPSDWRTVASAHSVGYRRIVDLPGVATDRLRVVVTGSRGVPVLSAVRPVASPESAVS